MLLNLLARLTGWRGTQTERQRFDELVLRSGLDQTDSLVTEGLQPDVSLARLRVINGLLELLSRAW